MSNISIPENDNPIRTQASLGGNQKYRNMGNVSGQAYLVRGQVTHVYYQKGTLDFNPYGSSSSSETTDGSGSAPIPVDFWGTNTDGKVFGCYRPVKIGSQVLVAYINGDTSYPIVVGIYPDNEKGYELISPVPYNLGDDSTDSVQGDSLGEKKLYANQQLRYMSGKGDILKSMGGKSFLYISKNDSGYLDDINYAYDQISDFYDRDGNQINPTQTKAQSWLLVHEDNDSDENSDGHRTRFYLNKAGELMVAFMNKNDASNITLLEASKDTGFKLTRRFDTSDLTEESNTYVQLGIGNGNKVNITSVDSGDATTFDLENGSINLNTPEKGTISFNNVSVDTILGKVSDAQNTANNAADKADNAYLAGETAKSAASDAASQALAASQAGEEAKSAAVDAKAAGEDAKAEAKDTQNRIIYYSSISQEKDVAIPGKYIIVNTDTYIKSATIQTAHIADAAITTAKIANAAIGTAQIEDAAITTAKIGNAAIGTAQIEDAAITDAKVGDLSANHLKAGTIDFSVINGTNINASNITVGKLVANQLEIKSLDELSNNLGTVDNGTLGNLNNWGSVKIYADVYAHTFSNLNGTFTADANGGVVASNLTIRGVTNLVYNAALLGNSGTYPNTKVPGWNLFTTGYYSNATLHDGVPSIGFNSSTGGAVWTTFAQSKLYPLNGLTGQPYSASVWFIEDGSDPNMLYQFTLAFFDTNGNRINGYVGQTWSGISSAQPWRYITINKAVSPSNAAYVGLQYWAYNGTGHALFSSPMLTQTAQSTGYQPDTGNIISAGTITGSSFYGGSVINNSNNTAGYYPMSIDSLGTYNSTYIDSAVALRASVQSGAILYNYRSMIANSGQYVYSDTVINGQGLTVDSGYTTVKDTTFSASSTETAYVSISTTGGLFLHGSDANIDFGGHLSDNETNVGMYMNPYGNIIGKSSSDYWQVSKQGADNTGGGATARFGIDTGGKGTINFYRPLFVDEIGAFTSSNGGALLVHDQKGTSQMVFRNDGNPQVVSASIYNRTYSSGSTVTVTSYGTLGRITSASKYKLDIVKDTSIDKANKLLTLDMSSWVDKSSAESLAESKTNGSELSEPEMNVFRHYGLIAEDLIKAGLDEFVIKGDKGQAEGIEYDRLWTVLIPKIRQLSNEQIQNTMTISKLENEIKLLKQEGN
ncbi:tail fiber protein [Lactobacillus phage LpeD]|uniref:Tail fiber protein n=1 Tax=Lactobacillus phage LpeD TaxID=2041210 RepID=A0A291I9G1_9CAUD|nr:tail fiber protein [Lactobacillus phage LpeD]ATG86330.1 tail fiber protein [Lactobacillus phage LpeD]